MNQYDRAPTKQILLDKLKQGIINRKEAITLKAILEKEKEDATKQGDIELVIGIALLLGFVIKYISDEKIIEKIAHALFGKE